MKDNYDYIRNATDARLAEMMEPIGLDLALQFPEFGAIIGEASRRLKARSRSPFNSEAFDV